MNNRRSTPRQKTVRARRVVFTLARADQLPQASALIRSVKQHEADLAGVIILVDRADPTPALGSSIEIIPYDRLGVAHIENMSLWYNAEEFVAALKPAAFKTLFRQGYAEACYLASNAMVRNNLATPFAALAGSSLVLTPVITRPAGDDLAVLLRGVFDSRFLAMRNDASSTAWLQWWAERCFLHCRDDPGRGMHLDQRWLDIAPCFVTKTSIIPDVIGAIAAPVSDPVAPSSAFDRFADGRSIEPAMRRWLLRAIDEGRLDPHERLAIASAYFDEPDQTAEAEGLTMTRLMYQVWLDRPELGRVFDIHTPDGLDGYVDWFLRGEADIEPASLAAATALFEPSAADPSRAGRRTPPWPSVARACWDGPAASVEAWLARDVAVQIGTHRRLLPQQAALQWEKRADLQAAYPLDTLESFNDFVGWAITSACVENVIEAALFSAAFVAEMAAIAHHDEVPITAAMLATRSVPLRRDFLNGWEQFPADRRGRLAHGMWVTFIAPKVFGWPAAMVEPLWRYFQEVGPIACGRFRFNRAAIALLDLRQDVRRGFPLDNPQGRWRFLHWLTVEGLRELELTLDEFDPRLRRFLTEPAAILPGAIEAIEMVYRARDDLQAAFDITAPAGRQALHGWAERHFAQSYDATPLGIVAAKSSSRTPHPKHFARQARIGLTGHWTGVSGRGEDLRAAAAALDAVGFTDYLVIDRDTMRVTRPDGTMIPPEDSVHLDVNIVHMNADTAVDDWWLLRHRGVSSERSIGFWAWELERLPPWWRHAFSFYDELWASTNFARDAFAAEALRPVILMKMAVTIRQEPPRPRDSATTRFLVMFDFGSFIARKNPQAAVAAFLQAFPTGRERTQLIIKTQGGDPASPEWQQFRAACDHPRIEFLSTTMPRSDLVALLAGCDAYVSLHRAEGFGRVLAEAMLLGKPVIATGYSGSSDFISPDCAYVVGYTMRPVARDAYPGVDGQSWAEADIADAARFMRLVHQHPTQAHQIGLKGRQKVLEMYAPELVGREMLAALGFGQRPRRGRRVRAEALD